MNRIQRKILKYKLKKFMKGINLLPSFQEQIETHPDEALEVLARMFHEHLMERR